MKTTENQGKALEMAFYSSVVRNMKPNEYNEYISQIFALSLMAMRKIHGEEYVAGFVVEALENPIGYVVEQVQQH